jgi:hypothetical protein
LVAAFGGNAVSNYAPVDDEILADLAGSEQGGCAAGARLPALADTGDLDKHFAL